MLNLAAHEAECDSCGSITIAEVNGQFALYHNLLQRNPPCPPPHLERTTRSDKVTQTQVTDPFGNRLVFVKACAWSAVDLRPAARGSAPTADGLREKSPLVRVSL